MAAAPLDPVRSGTTALLLALALGAPVQAYAAPGQPERGVFITQIADTSRVAVTQRNSDSLAQVDQDGADNDAELTQAGTAPHKAAITQSGEGNEASARQDGDGSTELVLAQEGNGNSALVIQREATDGMTTGAKVQQLGNRNKVSLTQDGSDNQAELSQVGDDNTMTAIQLNDGNRLQWAQNGDGLSDLQITQTGGAAMQITQSMTGAQFAPPPGSGN